MRVAWKFDCSARCASLVSCSMVVFTGVRAIPGSGGTAAVGPGPCRRGSRRTDWGRGGHRAGRCLRVTTTFPSPGWGTAQSALNHLPVPLYRSGGGERVGGTAGCHGWCAAAPGDRLLPARRQQRQRPRIRFTPGTQPPPPSTTSAPPTPFWDGPRGVARGVGAVPGTRRDEDAARVRRQFADLDAHDGRPRSAAESAG